MKKLICILAILTVLLSCAQKDPQPAQPSYSVAIAGEYRIFDFYSIPTYGKPLIYPAVDQDSFYSNALQIETLGADKVKIRVQYRMDGKYYDWYQEVAIVVSPLLGSTTEKKITFVSPALNGSAEMYDGNTVATLVRLDFQNGVQPRYYIGGKR